MRLFTLILSLICLTQAHALTLNGRYTQGGYIIGQTAPGSSVLINEKPIELTPQGTFLYGLSRNASPELTIRASTPQGKVTYRNIIISPRDFETQTVKGVPEKTVNPNPQQNLRAQREAKAIKASRTTKSNLPYAFTCCQWPIKQEIQPKHITGVYGSRRIYNNGDERSWHKGTDLAFPTGTPIYPTAPGRVMFADDTFYNGNLVIIDHGTGLFSVYAHLDQLKTTPGALLSVNDVLGTLGSTGRSTGPHLHWGMYWHQMALDPILWLKDDNEG